MQARQRLSCVEISCLKLSSGSDTETETYGLFAAHVGTLQQHGLGPQQNVAVVTLPDIPLLQIRQRCLFASVKPLVPNSRPASQEVPIEGLGSGRGTRESKPR